MDSDTTRGSSEVRNTFLLLFTVQSRCLLWFSSELGTEELKILHECGVSLHSLIYRLHATEIFRGFTRYTGALALCAFSRTRSAGKRKNTLEHDGMNGRDEVVSSVADPSALESHDYGASRFLYRILIGSLSL